MFLIKELFLALWFMKFPPAVTMTVIFLPMTAYVCDNRIGPEA